MRQRFDVSLTVLVPIIQGGVAALAVLCSEYLPRLLPAVFPDDAPLVVALIAGLCVACVSVAFVYAALRPVRRLLATAAPAMALPTSQGRQSMGEFDRLNLVADQMAEVLGTLDARTLFPHMVGESRVMRGFFSQIIKVAGTDSTVLLLGDSGTGKELAARSIHDKSGRSSGPFVAVNCAAIPAGLLESELFGHEKGAFTGAVARKKGKFEQAASGTLFLDEIGDMPTETQAKILRALEARQFERVGGNVALALEVRVVAATHRDLPAMIRQGMFREDLFHRLNVFPVRLPPLRERREDIPLLAQRFLEALRPGATLSVEALQRLLAYDWPGNVRELKNTLERASVLAGEHEIGPQHLPGLAGEGPVVSGDVAETTDLDGRLAAYERSLIEAALARTGGMQSRAAALLGVKERSLWHRVKKLGIAPGSFKDAG